MNTAINTNLAALTALVSEMVETLVARYNEKGIYQEMFESEIQWLETGITVPPVDVVTSTHDADGHLWCLCYGDDFYVATSNPLAPEGVTVEVEGSRITFRTDGAEIVASENWTGKAEWNHFLLCPTDYSACRVVVGERKMSYGPNGEPRCLDWTGMWVDEMSHEEYSAILNRRTQAAVDFREEAEKAFGLDLG